MLTNDLVPCFVQTFKTDSKTGPRSSPQIYGMKG